jgi:hypothetical protein
MAFSEPTYRVPRDFYASEKYAESRVEVNPNTGPDGRPYGVGRVGICRPRLGASSLSLQATSPPVSHRAPTRTIFGKSIEGSRKAAPLLQVGWIQPLEIAELLV